MMPALRIIAARALRRDWRGMVVAIVLVGLVGAFVLSTLAGARRSSTAFDRFRRESRAADVELALDSVPPAQMREFERSPGVAGVGVLRADGVFLPSVPELLAIGATVDGRVGTLVDRGRLIAGRAADPSRADEVAVGEALAARLHVKVGDTIGFVSYTPRQVAAI